MSRLDDLIEELCPYGVEYKRFDEVCSLHARIGWQRLTKAEYQQTGDFMLITGTDFTPQNTINYDSCVYVSKERYEQDPKIQIQNEDVLITKDGTLGKVAQVKALDMPATLNGGIFVVRSIDGTLLPRYILHFLKSGFFMRAVNQQKTGSTISHLTQELFSRLLIPVPPLPVQQEIVRILDSFTELTAELTAELEARKKQYEYYRDRLIDTAQGEKGKLIDLLKQPITDGPHTTPKLVSEGVPFISATAVYDGKIHLDSAQGFITKEFDKECAKKYKPQKYDVFMVKSGSTTGKVAIVDIDDDFNIWSPLAALRAENIITARYIYHLLQTSNVQNQVITRMSHGSQPNLSMRILEQFDVKIPSFSEQERIVNTLDKMDNICNSMFNGLPAEISMRQKQYEYYRDKLLTFKPKEEVHE